MDKKNVTSYEAPEVKVIEVNLEKGFAASDVYSVSGWENGGEFEDSFDI